MELVVEVVLYFWSLQSMSTQQRELVRFTFGAAALLVGLCIVSPAHAGFSLGAAANYGILVEPNANNVQSSNGTVPGNVGIGQGLTGQFQNSSGSIVGNVDFAGTANVQNPGLIAGTISSNVAAVTSALDTVNNLASTLGAEAGTSITINIGNNGSQTIQASSGKLDGSGNEVFTVSGGLNLNSNSETTGLTINGTSSQFVVINFASLQNLNGAILLTGGLTSDNVLFNYTGGGNFNPSSNHHTLSGDFLAVGAKVTWNAVTLDGRLFGGSSGNDFQINSGFNLTQPISAIPEPASMVMGSTSALIGLGCAWRRYRRARA
jgi:hypothetical protein